MHFDIDDFNIIGYIYEKNEDGSLIIATRDFLHSAREPAFSQFLESITNIIFEKTGKNIKPYMIETLYISVDSNNKAKVSINETEIMLYGFSKKEVAVGDAISINDIAHIKSLKLCSKNNNESHKFIFLFNIGWRRGVCFDLHPINIESNTPMANNNHWIAQSYSFILFTLRLHLDGNSWKYLINNKFFPFISLNENSIKVLVNLSKENNKCFDEILAKNIFPDFEKTLVNLKEKWRKNTIIKVESSFIDVAVERYLAEDYISCISVIYPRIEKILRLHLSRHSEEPHLRKTYAPKNLSDSIQLNISETSYPHTPLLTARFSHYLECCFFESFNANSFEEKINRNSVGHGVASVEYFNRKYSTIAFLIIDQLYYYLNADGKDCIIKL